MKRIVNILIIVFVVNVFFTAYLWHIGNVREKQTEDDAALLYALSETLLDHIYETQLIFNKGWQ